MQDLLHLFIHALEHSATMLPFLIIAFAILEILEAKFEEKSSNMIEKSGNTGPLLGALLGLAPQCGFSVIGSNFYAKRIITLGTLIAIYLSTSDEALLILLTSPKHISDVILIMALKFVIGLTAGYLIDLILRKKAKQQEECHHCHHHDDSCEDEEIIGEEHCCSHTDWKAIIRCTIKRTISVYAFLLAIIFILEIIMNYIGENNIADFMLSGSVFQPFITALIGLIPNCAPSVILAQLYIEGAIGLGSVISGLCTSAGAGLIVLFKVNKGFKSNVGIVALLYFSSVCSGILIQIIK